MTRLRTNIYRLLPRLISPRTKRLDIAKQSNKESTHTGSAENKLRARDYYSRREIATLFFQPLFVIVVYLTIVWSGLKYYCEIRCLDDFLKTLRWKYSNYKFTQHKVDDN